MCKVTLIDLLKLKIESHESFNQSKQNTVSIILK